MKRSRDGDQKGKESSHDVRGLRTLENDKAENRISELLAKAMATLESRIKSKDLKPTVGDYLKLLQLEQEFEQEAPTEIKVTWVEPPAPSDGAK